MDRLPVSQYFSRGRISYKLSRCSRVVVDVCSFDDSVDSSRGVKLSLRGNQMSGKEDRVVENYVNFFLFL